ncbi:MAG: Na+/H+ antiporter NhaA [Canibacter sp.]
MPTSPVNPASHHPKSPSQLTARRRTFRLARRRETVRVTKFLRREKVGGIIIMVAALLGIALANSPAADAFFAVRGFSFGPSSMGLHLDVAHWAADGLLAIFFFIVGLELKNEFTHGALQKFSTALVPVAAAFGGVIVPALIFVAFNFGTDHVHGWAIPTATDIAFAVAILGLIAPGIPTTLRMFLLTVAVVDDFIAIVIIAIFYTDGVNFTALGISLIPIIVYGVLARVFSTWFAKTPWSAWLILLPIGVIAWSFFFLSGIHATIAGVLLAFTVPTRNAQGINLAERLAFRFQPLSTGIAVPIFAFFSAGVAIGGDSRFPFDPIVYGVIVGLVLGKPIGITLTTWLITKFTRAELGGAVTWRQLLGVASLAGVGFTVSLLVAELSFTTEAEADTARLAVMVGSVIAVGVASAFLFKPRTRVTA